MTGAWVEDELYTALGESIARAVLFSPGVFTDFKSELDAFGSVDQVSDFERIILALAWRCFSGWPGVKPAGFIVYAIAGEKLFEGHSENFVIADHANAVVGFVFVAEGQANRYGNVMAIASDCGEFFPSAVGDPGVQEKIFAAVARDAQLGKTHNTGTLPARFFNSVYDMARIVLPVEWCLVYSGACDEHGS